MICCFAPGMKRSIVPGIVGICCFFVFFSVAWASDLPAMKASALDAAIKQLDENARLREDFLVTFSDGTEYMLVSPPVLQPTDELRPVRRIPDEHTGQPADLIELSDGRFLLRMMTLHNGRKSFPIVKDIPISMRAALLPQHFTFPDGFLMPTAWKSLTGNLLVPPVTANPNRVRNYPLVIPDAMHDKLVLWNPDKGEVQRELPLHCEPSDIAASKNADKLFVGCLSEPVLYIYTLSKIDGQAEPIVLPAEAGSILEDSRYPRLYISHPSHPALTVFNIDKNAITKTISLRQPVGIMALSPFRKKLFAVSLPVQEVPSQEVQEEAPTRFSKLKGLFFKSSRSNQPVTKKPVTQYANLQIINLEALRVEKMIPALPDISTLHIQDEKILWMISRTQKAMQAFDLRWQEYSPGIALSEAPNAVGSDDQWLYFLLPQANAIARLDLKTLSWGSPIALDPQSAPGSFIVDLLERQIFVLAANEPGIQVVNLNRGEWVGTQKTGFLGSGRMAWLIPTQDLPDQRVKIKFQDGRLMLQSAQGLPLEKLLSDPHDPTKNHTLSEPAETPSTP